MSLERKFYDETQIIKEILNVDVEIHKQKVSLKKIELNHKTPSVTGDYLKEYHEKKLLKLKQNRNLLQEKLNYFIKEKIDKINAKISKHNELIKYHEEQGKHKHSTEISIQRKFILKSSINIEKTKINHLKISLVFLEKMQRNIEQGNFYPTEDMISIFKINLSYKEEIMQNNEFSFIEKLKLLNKISYDNCDRNNTSEEIDSAILIFIDVISLANAELKKDNQDTDIKRELYLEISHGLYYLTKIYLLSRENFNNHNIEKSIEKLYLLLSSLNYDQNLKKNLQPFTQGNCSDFKAFSHIDSFIQFLKNKNELNKNIISRNKYSFGTGAIGAAMLLPYGISAAIAGGLCFFTGAKAAQKLKEYCEPRKLSKLGKSS